MMVSLWTETCWSSFHILKCFNNSTFFNVVCISWTVKCWILLMHGVTMEMSHILMWQLINYRLITWHCIGLEIQKSFSSLMHLWMYCDNTDMIKFHWCALFVLFRNRMWPYFITFYRVQYMMEWTNMWVGLAVNLGLVFRQVTPTNLGLIVLLVHTSSQGRIKLFGAPRQWKHFRPLFQAVFLLGGITPPRLSQTPRLPFPRQK